jgi:hypothetical protein
MMLPVNDVVPFLVDSDTGLEPNMDEMDMNRTSRLLQRVPDSEQGVYPKVTMRVSMLTFRMKMIV